MLQNAYFLAKIGADTAENERNSAEIGIQFSPSRPVPCPWVVIAGICGRNRFQSSAKRTWQIMKLFESNYRCVIRIEDQMSKSKDQTVVRRRRSLLNARII